MVFVATRFRGISSWISSDQQLVEAGGRRAEQSVPNVNGKQDVRVEDDDERSGHH
jgi:hypothetical protein